MFKREIESVCLQNGQQKLFELPNYENTLKYG